MARRSLSTRPPRRDFRKREAVSEARGVLRWDFVPPVAISGSVRRLNADQLTLQAGAGPPRRDFRKREAGA